MNLWKQNSGHIPISTGVAMVGTLNLMDSSGSADLERARPPVRINGRQHLPAGAVGAGQTTTICNYTLLGSFMAGASEAIAPGVANGVGPEVLSEIPPSPHPRQRTPIRRPSDGAVHHHVRLL